MKKPYVWIIVGLLAVVIIYNLSSSIVSESLSYEEKMQQERQETFQFLKNSSKSPIPDQAAFQGLSYFPLNQDFRVQARLELIQPPPPVEIANSQGGTEIYFKYAWAHFTIQGKEQKLLLLRDEEKPPMLFLAFTDETSGKETYGGGRYINVPYQDGQTKVEIDFNRAYHPYCVYNPEYICPLPPKENQINLAIKAGEKLSEQK